MNEVQDHVSPSGDEPPPPKKVAKCPKAERRTCTFYVPQKNRTCRLLAMRERVFCAEHATNDGITSDDIRFRVPCPYNSNQ